MKKKIMFVFGTRPEAIKMCPIIKEMKFRDHFDVKVVVTGQHREMLDQVLNVFNVIPDYDLDIMKKNQDLFDVTTNVLNKIKDVLDKENPNLVLVHGDTSTTFSTALACFYKQIDIGHVEAGLRTFNMNSPYPEEFNRCATGLIAKFHFAPTKNAKENLIKEGRNKSEIYVTGNSAIDALKTTVKEDYNHKLLDWSYNSKLILITAHRRENLGEPMENMFRAIKRVLDENEDVKVVYPIHKNPYIRDLANEIFNDNKRMKIVEPLDVIDFHNIMARSYMILTDSGGIQEEAPSLGKPVLVMRENTERPEGVKANTLKLVGTSEDNIYKCFTELLQNESIYKKMSEASNPYGDGKTSIYICEILKNEL